jgi:hypothetical protein
LKPLLLKTSLFDADAPKSVIVLVPGAVNANSARRPGDAPGLIPLHVESLKGDPRNKNADAAAPLGAVS